MTSIVSVDELCVAVEQILTDHLSGVMARLGFTGPEYTAVRTWQQAPTPQAVASAKLPAGAIVSPGLAEPPTRRGRSEMTASWLLPVGLYVRGADHAATAAQIRNWCAGIRHTVLAHAALGGLSQATSWRGEQYQLVPEQRSARTLAGGVVTFAVQTTMAPLPPAAGPWPLVQTTHADLTVR